MLIDYTQYSTAETCLLLWYEKYYRGLKKVIEGQSSSALTLGSLVHVGLENYYKTGSYAIDTSIIEELKPTPETLNNAEFLIMGWVKTHPKEEWSMQRFEERLLFPVNDKWQGAAKLDKFFEVTESTIIKGGIEDVELYPGYWSMDYKTLGGSKDRANYIKRWNVNMQADFQTLALREFVSNRGEDPNKVKGVLIGVIEKPHEYVPKRKCKGCGNTFDIGLFTPFEDGYACGWCGFKQAVTPLKKKPGYTSDPVTYYIKIERSPERLQEAIKCIELMTEDMEAVISGKHIRPRWDACVHQFFGECEFYRAHITPGFDASQHRDFVKSDTLRYMESNN